MSPEKNEIPETQENATELIENEIDNETKHEQYDEEVLDDCDEIETEPQKSKSKSSKIFLYIIYAVVIILCLVLIARNLFFKNKDKSINENTSSASSSESAAKNAPKKIIDLYVLANLSDGYELSNQNISETNAVSTYKNKKTEITLTQSTIDGYKPEYDVNDKDIVISNFYSGAGQDYNAYQIDGKCYIVWTTDEYTFEIKTSLKKSETIPFIFNVQKADESSSSSIPE